jgi:hypothetical protein
MLVKRIGSVDLAVEKLPDGSTAIFDAVNKTVYSLNATAAVAWEACSGAASLAQILVAMQRSFNPTVTEEIALEAIFQLQEKGLVEIVAPPPTSPTRRSMVGTVGGVVAPLVLALTSAEQRAFAVGAGSGTTTTTTPPPPPGTSAFRVRK